MIRESSHIYISRREQLFALVILSVYMPMVLLASLHVHSLNENIVIFDCHECHTDVHHSGHITSSPQHHDDCLLCRFLTTQVDKSKDIVCFTFKQTVSKIELHQAASPIPSIVAHPSLRAPPFIL